MTATVNSTAKKGVKDKELVSFGLVESASVNSITDFTPSKLDESKVFAANENEDFANIFICHLIFYSVLCISIVLHILIDLGLGSFLKNQFIQFLEIAKNTAFEKNPAFA